MNVSGTRLEHYSMDVNPDVVCDAMKKEYVRKLFCAPHHSHDTGTYYILSGYWVRHDTVNVGKDMAQPIQTLRPATLEEIAVMNAIELLRGTFANEPE